MRPIHSESDLIVSALHRGVVQTKPPAFMTPFDQSFRSGVTGLSPPANLFLRLPEDMPFTNLKRVSERSFEVYIISRKLILVVIIVFQWIFLSSGTETVQKGYRRHES